MPKMPSVFVKQDNSTQKKEALTEAEAHSQVVDNAEDAIEAAFGTGKADRASITRQAQLDAAMAVARAGEAMEADEAADEAARLAVITENLGDREKTKNARARAKAARKAAKLAHREATKSAKEAYDAIKFSQPGKLGLMRVVQLFYAINIASTLFALLMTSRDTIVYNSVTIFDWVTIILQGVGLWFFLNYFKITKKFVIFTAAFSIVSYLVSAAISQSFTAFGFLTNMAWNLFLILYFSLSSRVDAVLVNDFSSYRPKRQAEVKVKRRGWPLVRNLIMYFIVFSVLGHWMEAAMCQLIRLGLVQGEYDPTNTMLWRDWLYPYPMEGAAVVIIALVLYPLWQYLLRRFDRPIWAYVVSFFANALTCTIIEFSMGLIVNANHQLWDYSDMFGNIMGQVCLQNTMAFGVAASLIAWFVYPMMERWLARVPDDTMNIVFVVIAVIGGILWSLYIVDPPQNHQTTQEAIKAETMSIERDNLSVGASSVEVEVRRLERDLQKSTSLSQEDRDKIQKEIDELNNKINDIHKSIDAVVIPTA